MTPDEAQELRIFLTNQLIEHGFSSIAEQANRRLLERLEYDPKGLQVANDPNPEQRLIDFLSETIEVFRNNSNENYSEMLAKINKNLDGEKIEGILVELQENRKSMT